MGEFVKQQKTPHEVIHHMNSRFAPGEPLREMIQIQKEFQVFSPKNSLQQVYRLLNIAPSDFSERGLFYRYLDLLKRVPSDQAGVNGHDRIIKARQENLESSSPLPMFTMTHRDTADKRVTVTRGKPTPHEDQEYMVISIPTKPSKPIPTPGARPAGPKRAARKKAGA
jgi:hypothetical protein